MSLSKNANGPTELLVYHPPEAEREQDAAASPTHWPATCRPRPRSAARTSPRLERGEQVERRRARRVIDVRGCPPPSRRAFRCDDFRSDKRIQARGLGAERCQGVSATESRRPAAGRPPAARRDAPAGRLPGSRPRRARRFESRPRHRRLDERRVGVHHERRGRPAVRGDERQTDVRVHPAHRGEHGLDRDVGLASANACAHRARAAAKCSAPRAPRRRRRARGGPARPSRRGSALAQTEINPSAPSADASATRGRRRPSRLRSRRGGRRGGRRSGSGRPRLLWCRRRSGPRRRGRSCVSARDVLAGPAGDVVEDHRAVRRVGDGGDVADEARPAWACCSTGSRRAGRRRRRRRPAREKRHALRRVVRARSRRRPARARRRDSTVTARRGAAARRPSRSGSRPSCRGRRPPRRPRGGRISGVTLPLDDEVEQPAEGGLVDRCRPARTG